VKITAIRLDRMRLPFGGAARRLPAYASFGEARSPRDRAEAALAAKSAGFRAMKIRISRTDPGACVQAVRATRAAVGDDIAVMADLNQWWRMPGDRSPALDQHQVRRIAAELADGYLTVPGTPGLGAEIDESAVTRRRIP
jgi:L-alanine-DL-glutamate epimerase-like enolase superfamily enzyme